MAKRYRIEFVAHAYWRVFDSTISSARVRQTVCDAYVRAQARRIARLLNADDKRKAEKKA